MAANDDDFKKLVREDLSALKTTLIDVRVSQAEHGTQLKEHMRRTDLAEARLDLLQKEVEPLKAHTAVFAALGKALGLLGTGVGIAFAIGKMLGRF